MSRIALDSVKYANLAGLRWPHLIGYANGRISAWTEQEIATARSRGQLLALVDVLGTDPHRAGIIDWERGDVQSPAVLHRWVQARNQFRDDATVYVQPPKIRTIVNAVGREPCNLLVVDLTADGEPPFGLPDYGPLPPNVRIIGRQFVFGPRSGGNYDMSVIYADDWHPDQPHPANYAPVRLAAAAELGVSGSLQWAANVPTEPDPAAASGPVAITTTAELAAEIPSAELTAGYSAALAAGLRGADVAPGTGPLATVTPLITAADAAAAAHVIRSDETIGRQDDIGTLAGVDQAAELADVDQAAELADVDQAAELAGVDQAAAAPVDQAVDVDQARARLDQAAAELAGVTKPGLNHEFIRATLADVGEVARQLRGARLGTIAGHLEQAAAIAWEVGSALKSAGL